MNTPHLDEQPAFVATAVRAFFTITEAWQLTDADRVALLGDPVSEAALSAWRLQPPQRLSPETLRRVSFVVAIYEGLRRLFRQATYSSSG
jgi:hypothetical protein